MCNPDEFGDDGRPHVAVQGVQTDPYEISQASFVDMVFEFLERYAIAPGADAKS
jgi:hypothetical protein